MGRHSTGAYTVDDSLEINISNLKRSDLFIKGESRRGTITWRRRGHVYSSIGIEAYYTESEKYIRLYYTNTDRQGTKTNYDYNINFIEVESNLGKGSVLYFLCPSSGKKCRKLYNAYGYQRWKSRTAYKNRIYYNLQTASKFDRYNTKFWELDRKIQNDNRRKTKEYNGKQTKRAVADFHLRLQWARMDELRWSAAAMPLRLRNELLLHEDLKCNP